MSHGPLVASRGILIEAGRPRGPRGRREGHGKALCPFMSLVVLVSLVPLASLVSPVPLVSLVSLDYQHLSQGQTGRQERSKAAPKARAEKKEG